MSETSTTVRSGRRILTFTAGQPGEGPERRRAADCPADTVRRRGSSSAWRRWRTSRRSRRSSPRPTSAGGPSSTWESAHRRPSRRLNGDVRVATRLADVRFCRIAGIAHPDTYALFGILIRGSVDSAASCYIVAAHPQRSMPNRRGWAPGQLFWVIARARRISWKASAAGFRFACYWAVTGGLTRH